MVFGPRGIRRVAGILLVGFQVMLILSGNLSWLNYLTISVCLWSFDDRIWESVLPAILTQRNRPQERGCSRPPEVGRRWIGGAAALSERGARSQYDFIRAGYEYLF